MTRKITLLVIFISLSWAISAQTSLQGKVNDGENGEPILFGTIALYKNDVLITGTETDFDGNYIFGDIDPGTYDIEITYVGYQTTRINGILVKAGQSNKMDAVISQGVLMDEIVIKDYKAPLIDFDNTSQGKTITAENIRSLPTKNINAIAATSAGLSSVDGGAISIRGSRANATDYYVDGVRVSNTSSIPQSEIDQMQVITGGLEAKYGDVTGGIISITTKGPSSKFTGGLEVETSEFLDAYGYKELSGNVSGPIIKGSEGKSILGFRISGRYRKIEDNNPSAIGVYRAPESLITDLENNPTTFLGGTELPTGQFKYTEDVGDPLDARPNNANTDLSGTAKIDARITDNIDITLGGNFFISEDLFTPSAAWSLLNWQNNPISYREGYKGNFRFRHKLGRQSFGGDLTDEEKANSNSLIKNASYTIQLGYEKNYGRNEDIRQTDQLFNYGYYGSQGRTWMPVISDISDTTLWDGQIIYVGNGIPTAMQGYIDVEEGEFAPNLDINGTLARYNEINGRLDDNLDDVWGLYSNVGQVYNVFSKSETDILTLNVVSGFDLLPGGSESGRHSIQFGFSWENRTNRAWSINPRELWTAARQLANADLVGVNTDLVLDTIGGQYLVYAPQYEAPDGNENSFYQNVRTLTNSGLDEYVNIDVLDPTSLSLDMFSAPELNSFPQLNLSYYGYDYLGNKLGTDVTFNDFFTSKDGNNIRSFDVAPWQPIYWSGFIQDKFTYKDIIFRLGVRADYYDANSKVLRDPYSLYEVETASEFFANTGGTKPPAVGDDYKVYLAGEDSETVIGYRLGDDWYSPNGTLVSGGNVLFGGGLVYPSYKEKDGDKRNIQLGANADEAFNIDNSFKDYDPQLNFMPRLSFSFPISEDAGFFAHYDILVQRPPSNTIMTALDYYYFQDGDRLNPNGAPANNPDLKPEKTEDWEMGFHQKLTNSSALKISAFYKGLEDMIQRRFYFNLPAPLNNYEAYGNLDFGTVKGFSFTYDLRRTGNVELSASYTLQFANATGSDANSSSGLSNRGIQREVIPLSYDERHRITANVDYRYGGGKNYKGPVVGGMNIFADAGLNLLLTTVSGRPYTANSTITSPLTSAGIEGDINGPRRPWTFNADMRIDKRFNINLSEGGRALGMSVYFRVENVFDTRNVRGVYAGTGDPDDDGFLASSFGQDQLDQIATVGQDVRSYLSSYQWRVASPGNYFRPRRMYLGAIFDF